MPDALALLRLDDEHARGAGLCEECGCYGLKDVGAGGVDDDEFCLGMNYTVLEGVEGRPAVMDERAALVERKITHAFGSAVMAPRSSTRG